MTPPKATREHNRCRTGNVRRRIGSTLKRGGPPTVKSARSTGRLAHTLARPQTTADRRVRSRASARAMRYVEIAIVAGRACKARRPRGHPSRAGAVDVAAAVRRVSIAAGAMVAVVVEVTEAAERRQGCDGVARPAAPCDDAYNTVGRGRQCRHGVPFWNVCGCLSPQC
jgi:hypothetical protein